MSFPYKSRLSDCDSLKAELDRHRPLPPDVYRQLRLYFRVSMTYTSNALEGNTLSESETKIVLEEGITIGGKPLKDHLEAIGHARAFDALEDLIAHPAPTESDLMTLHALVTAGQEDAQPGRYRDRGVIITGTEFVPPPPDAVPGQMRRFVSEKLPPWLERRHAVECAALAHLELVTIHPFSDGNGRTARLLMNLLLLKAGYTPTVIPPVVRNDYMAALRMAQKRGQTQPFLDFISEMTLEALKDYLRLLRALLA